MSGGGYAFNSVREQWAKELNLPRSKNLLKGVVQNLLGGESLEKPLDRPIAERGAWKTPQYHAINKDQWLVGIVITYRTQAIRNVHKEVTMAVHLETLAFLC